MLQFCTILPLGRPADYNAYARRSWLLPLAGWVTGGAAAAIVWFLPSGEIAAAVALAVVLLLSGFHHLDGLLDLGDGMMAHESREKRVIALCDRQTGAGGVGMGITVTLVAFAGLAASPIPALSILAAEVAAKGVMAGMTALGQPFKEGMYSYIRERAKPWFAPLAALLCAPLLLFIPSLPLTAAAAAAIGTGIVLYLISARLFGGINGDVVGAANEWIRAAVVLAIALVYAL